MALYVINTTRAVTREEKNVTNFLKLPTEKWVENSFEVEGALYWTLVSSHIYDHEAWKKIRIDLLKRIIVLAHARYLMPTGGSSIADKTLKEYSVYKPYFLFFGLADFISTILFKKCVTSNENNWPTTLADYIRNNDQTLLEQSKKMLSTFEEELMPCESFSEFLDAIGMLEQMPEPDREIQEILSKLP
jgi:E3 ubiquitin-protein ligase UBR4